MPRRLPVPCSAAGCPALVRRGRCEDHQVRRAESERDYDAERKGARKRGYDRTWQGLRLAKLGRNPVCEPCEQRGVTTPATEVDHIVPLRMVGARLDLENLQAICRSCHAKKTQEETRSRRV